MNKIVLCVMFAIGLTAVGGMSLPAFTDAGLIKRSAQAQNTRFFLGNDNNNSGRRPPPGRRPGGRPGGGPGRRPGGRPGGFGRPPVQQTQPAGFDAANPLVLGGTALAGAALGAGAATIFG
eukprot:TRINITY_DN10281_c0_g1_i1.p1 TRINITY_DN10281_c0_g1~~TRINITY_DN10281_c0_g1_i1.p1  ORF type:complete len:121 (-),score=34.68 TRINITY_DN10281_c0_g1_i1:86-448(-)